MGVNEFASELSTALRDEARELGMAVDVLRLERQLQLQIRTTDRRRRTWVGVAAAAVLVLVAGWFAAGTVRTQPAPPATHPSPSPTHLRTTPPYPLNARLLQRPLTAQLPNWVAYTDAVYGEVGEYDYSQSDCGGRGDPCPAGQDVAIALYDVEYMYPPQPGSKVTKTSYSAYVHAWKEIQPLGFGTVTDVRATTVAGRPATAMTVSFTKGVDGLARCSVGNAPLHDCWSVDAKRTFRLVIVNQGTGTPPVLLYESWNTNNPRAQALASEFDTWLATVRFH